MPERIQLSRAKGWRMPAGAVKVDRSTKWGNPFVVGEYGTAAECVRAFRVLLGGCLALAAGKPSVAYQRAYQSMFAHCWRELAGKDLACWCAPGKPCHADVLIEAVAFLEKKNA